MKFIWKKIIYIFINGTAGTLKVLTVPCRMSAVDKHRFNPWSERVGSDFYSAHFGTITNDASFGKNRFSSSISSWNFENRHNRSNPWGGEDTEQTITVWTPNRATAMYADQTPGAFDPNRVYLSMKNTPDYGFSPTLNQTRPATTHVTINTVNRLRGGKSVVHTRSRYRTVSVKIIVFHSPSRDIHRKWTRIIVCRCVRVSYTVRHAVKNKSIPIARKPTAVTCVCQVFHRALMIRHENHTDWNRKFERELASLTGTL